MAFSPGTNLISPPIVETATMNAITVKALQPVMGDAIFQPSTALGQLVRERRRIQSATVLTSIAAVDDNSGGAYYGAQPLARRVVDAIRPAEQQWRFYQQPIVIPETDLVINVASNPDAVHNLLLNKMMIATGSYIVLLARAIWGDPNQPSAISVDTIPTWLNAATSVVAGIDRNVSSNAFWVNNAAYDMTTFTLQNLLIGWHQYVGRQLGYDYPQCFFMGPIAFASLEGLMVQQIRYLNSDADAKSAQAVMREHFKFKQATCIEDPFLEALSPGNAFLINFRYLYPVFLLNFYFNFRPWMSPSQQFILVSYIRLAWNLTCISPKKAGQVFINMPSASTTPCIVGSAKEQSVPITDFDRYFQ